MAQEKDPKKTRSGRKPSSGAKSKQVARTTSEPPEELTQPRGIDSLQAEADNANGSDGGETDAPIRVKLEGRNEDPPPTSDITLWQLIKLRQPSFDKYRNFLDELFCSAHCEEDPRLQHRFSLQRTDAYDGIKIATDMFLRYQCAVLRDVDQLKSWVADVEGKVSDSQPAPDQAALEAFAENYLQGIVGGSSKTLPYLAGIREKLSELAINDCNQDSSWARYAAACSDNELLCDRVTSPCLIELIWSYWMEQGMLVQTMNAIGLRFQNRRVKSLKDPLAHLTLDPLRPLNNLMWGFLQDERDRLTVVRRAHEYDHEYGLQLAGKAVENLTTIDSRSAFLEAFHTLLNMVTRFYEQDDDRQIKADAFPVLNALRDLHMILARGAHNQFGDLPWVARVEMMVMQYLLARPEMREFFGSRVMVLLKEPWMDRVDAMKKLQSWPETSVTHFYDLAVNGEQLLLSVRYGHWNEASSDQAFHWARTWRNEIQRYIFAYRAATGVDLTGMSSKKEVKVSTLQPSQLILRRAKAAKRRSA